MRAMLKAVKIDSYLGAASTRATRSTCARSGRRRSSSTTASSPSAWATRRKSPTIVEHPTLGRLLIFDATDENTPVGDLPDHEQGSLALVDHKDSSALLRMPVTPPEANRLERVTEAQLDADGAIHALWTRLRTGNISLHSPLAESPNRRVGGVVLPHSPNLHQGFVRPDAGSPRR